MTPEEQAAFRAGAEAMKMAVSRYFRQRSRGFQKWGHDAQAESASEWADIVLALPLPEPPDA